MESLHDEQQRKILMRFFKTAPGEYGEGDMFIGLKVPQTREVVKAVAKDIELSEVPVLLKSKWHEVRLCGLLILVAKFERLATRRLADDAEAMRRRDEIVQMYLQYADQANNWDLVDMSAPKILGHWLMLPSGLGGHDYKQRLLDELADSTCLWRQRISMVCTWKTMQMGDYEWCLRYARKHLHHPHDLMHKAVGCCVSWASASAWICCATSLRSMCARCTALRSAMLRRRWIPRSVLCGESAGNNPDMFAILLASEKKNGKTLASIGNNV